MGEKVSAKSGTDTINVAVSDINGAKSAATDPRRSTSEVTRRKLFWMAAEGPMLASGHNPGLVSSIYAFSYFVRAGIFYWLSPDKWSFTLSGGEGIIRKRDPWKYGFLAEALINRHYKGSYLAVGLGFSARSQSLTSAGVDAVTQAGTNVFKTWNSSGSIFVEFRAPLGRNFRYNNRVGLGFRVLF